MAHGGGGGGVLRAVVVVVAPWWCLQDDLLAEIEAIAASPYVGKDKSMLGTSAMRTGRPYSRNPLWDTPLLQL